MRYPGRLSNLLLTLTAGAAAACARGGGNATCGIAALTGPLAIKESFARGNALASAPEFAPPRLTVRLVAGPAWPATITIDSSREWSVKLQGTMSRAAHVGYGVLVIDGDTPQGILAYDGLAIRGAARLGTLDVGDTTVPLLGVHFNLASVRDDQCPLFPDSLK